MINLEDKENYYPGGLIPINKDKKHAKLSASGSSKWLNCPGSVNAESNLHVKTSKFAEEGTLAHELAEVCLRNYKNSSVLNNDYKSATDRIGETITCKSGESTISTLVTKEMAEYVQEYIDYVLAYETDNSQLYIEEKVDFSNIVPEGFGTLDAAIFDYKSGVCHIFDLKYGKGVSVYAEENTQAMLYALGLYNDFKCLDVIRDFKIHIVQPRINNYSSWNISIKDLIIFGKFASEKAREALKPNAPRIPGEKQCKWCKAKHNCPALMKFTEEIILESFENLNDKKEIIKDSDKLNKNQIKLIVDNKKLIEDFLKSVEDHVYDKLCEGENFKGYKLVEGRSNRKWNDDAEKALKEELGEDAYQKKLITITSASKKIKKDKIDSLTYKPKGELKLVPDSDKRKSIDDIKNYFDKI